MDSPGDQAPIRPAPSRHSRHGSTSILKLGSDSPVDSPLRHRRTASSGASTPKKKAQSLLAHERSCSSDAFVESSPVVSDFGAASDAADTSALAATYVSRRESVQDDDADGFIGEEDLRNGEKGGKRGLLGAAMRSEEAEISPELQRGLDSPSLHSPSDDQALIVGETSDGGKAGAPSSSTPSARRAGAPAVASVAAGTHPLPRAREQSILGADDGDAACLASAVRAKSGAGKRNAASSKRPPAALAVPAARLDSSAITPVGAGAGTSALAPTPPTQRDLAGSANISANSALGTPMSPRYEQDRQDAVYKFNAKPQARAACRGGMAPRGGAGWCHAPWARSAARVTPPNCISCAGGH